MTRMKIEDAFERLCAKYGDVLANGGTPERYFAGVHLAKAIARAMRCDIQEVIDATIETK